MGSTTNFTVFYPSALGTCNDKVIRFDRIIFEYPTGIYNAGTYSFIPPVRGIYRFECTLAITSPLTGTGSFLYLWHTTSGTTHTIIGASDGYAIHNNFLSVMVELPAGNMVSFGVSTISGETQIRTSGVTNYFSGELINRLPDII